MFWSKKKKQVPSEELKLITLNRLTIIMGIMEDSKEHCLEVVHKPGARIETPWRDFYKWYFGKTSSPSYMMKTKDETRLISRKNIVSFTVSLRTELYHPPGSTIRVR